MKSLSKPTAGPVPGSVQWLDDRERRQFASALERIGDLPTDQPARARDRIDALLLIAKLLIEAAHRYAGSSGVNLPLTTVKYRLSAARAELRQLRAAA